VPVTSRKGSDCKPGRQGHQSPSLIVPTFLVPRPHFLSCDARRLPNVGLCNPGGRVSGREGNVTAGRRDGAGGARAWPVGRSDAERRSHPTGIRPPPPFSGGMWAGRGARPTRGSPLTLCAPRRQPRAAATCRLPAPPLVRVGLTGVAVLLNLLLV
jgi:hypothetical protein